MTFTLTPYKVFTVIPVVSNTSFVSGGENILVRDGHVIIDKGLCYDTTTNPTFKVSYGSGNTDNFTQVILNLAADTHYYVRAYTVDDSGHIEYGEIYDAIIPPVSTNVTITTVPPFSITQTSIVSGGYSISNITGKEPGFEKGVEYSSSPSMTSSKQVKKYTSLTILDTTINPYLLSLIGLTANTTYYIRAYIRITISTNPNTYSYYYGNIYEVKTLPTDVVVTTCSNTSVTIEPDVTYVVPKGATIISSDTVTNVLESKCIDISLIPYVATPTPDPSIVPSAPTITSATSPGRGYIRIAYTIPSSTGGSPILNYKLYIYDSVTNVLICCITNPYISTSNPIEYHTGVSGANYYVKLSAVNANGEGALATSSIFHVM
jgi:hypothetical protein